MQQDQVDQAYDYILKKITESNILEKTDVNHLISELKEKYSLFKELAFVVIVRAWYSSDCHVRLVNIPKFSHQNDLLEREKGKTTLSMELKEETATIDECLVTGKSKSTSTTHDKTHVDPIIDHDKNLITPGTQEDQKSNFILEDFDQWYTSLEKTTLDKKALQSKICEKFRELAELAKETIKVKTRQEGEFSIPNIQGLIRRYQKCYKGNCQCMKGKPHGPYYYLRIYLNGKEIQIYLGRAV